MKLAKFKKEKQQNKDAASTSTDWCAFENQIIPQPIPNQYTINTLLASQHHRLAKLLFYKQINFFTIFLV